MEKIVIKDLYTAHTETFMDDLEVTKKSIGIVLGGTFWGLNPGIYINTVYDGVNTISNTYEGAGNFHDNKINTVDYSRTNNVRLYR
ncbi:MAG: hypothetical protein ACKO11_03275 [Cuspidothrix sp.]